MSSESPNANSNSVADNMSRRPPGWLETSLTLTMEKAHHNVVATFVNDPASKLMILANNLFIRLRDKENTCDIEATYSFFIHSYSHWLGAVRCWSSQHLPPCYALGRASIECTLYGNYLHLNDLDDAIKHIYINRKGKNNKPTRAFLEKFSTGRLVNALPEPPRELARSMYEIAIELGAHPNLLGVFAGIVPTGDGRQNHIYIGADDQAMRVGAIFVISVALCSLLTFDELLSGREDETFKADLSDLRNLFSSSLQADLLKDSQELPSDCVSLI